MEASNFCVAEDNFEPVMFKDNFDLLISCIHLLSAGISLYFTCSCWWKSGRENAVQALLSTEASFLFISVCFLSFPIPISFYL